MTDEKLLKELGLSYGEAATIIGVGRQVLHRAITAEEQPKKRRGIPSSAQEVPDGPYYLNADRLFAIWLSLKGSEKADLVRKELIERYPYLPDIIAPYESRNAGPDAFKFSEIWVFCRDPLELHDLVFREKMRVPLADTSNSLVYFVPSDDIARRLLHVLNVLTDNKLKNVFIVSTVAVHLCPHSIIVFTREAPDASKVMGAVLPKKVGDEPAWRSWIQTDSGFYAGVRDTLLQAELLDARDRFALPKTQSVGGGSIPEFRIIYPEVPQ